MWHKPRPRIARTQAISRLRDVTSASSENHNKLRQMENEDNKTLECAHSEFDKQNYQQAEDLYTKYITSCLQSRYFLYRSEVVLVSCLRLWRNGFPADIC